VAEAANGLHAYNKYVEFNPDLIFLNLDMPIYNGVNALQRILEYDENAIVIILSHANANREIYKCIDLGATHYIEKPIDEYGLSKVISDVKNIIKRRNNV
jgi:YesN/AraC family two-component response regulator